MTEAYGSATPSPTTPILWAIFRLTEVSRSSMDPAGKLCMVDPISAKTLPVSKAQGFDHQQGRCRVLGHCRGRIDRYGG